jgi:hypothetical protein
VTNPESYLYRSFSPLYPRPTSQFRPVPYFYTSQMAAATPESHGQYLLVLLFSLVFAISCIITTARIAIDWSVNELRIRRWLSDNPRQNKWDSALQVYFYNISIFVLRAVLTSLFICLIFIIY